MLNLYRDFLKFNLKKTTCFENGSKILIETSPKKICRRKINMQKLCTKCIIRELQIKTSVTYHYTLMRRAKTQNTDNIKCWWGLRAAGTTLLVGIQGSLATLKDSLAVSYKIKHKLKIIIWTNNHTINACYLTKGVVNLHPNICTFMFTVALFITAKTWKKPRCPSLGEWISKLW